MRRRSFLAAAALVPWWIRRAFADASVHDGDGGALGAARERARVAGRPLVAIVIPPRDEQKDEWGTAWGEYLQHGSDEQLAPLHYAEVCCAPAAAVGVASDPPFVLLIDGTATFARGGGDLPPVQSSRSFDDRREEQVIDRRIAVVASKIAGLFRESRALERVSPTTPREASAEVRRRLVDRPPPGSHWARHSTCGYAHVIGLVDDEASRAEMAECGMGHVPEKSASFLYFYAQTPQRRAMVRR
jgi:hypothetical protein